MVCRSQIEQAGTYYDWMNPGARQQRRDAEVRDDGLLPKRLEQFCGLFEVPRAGYGRRSEHGEQVLRTGQANLSHFRQGRGSMDTVIQRLDRTGWGACASRFLDYNYRHTWEFAAACADRVDARSEQVAVARAGEILGLASVRIKTIPVLGTGIAYINGGPLVRRNEDRDVDRLRLCLQTFVHEYVEKRRLVLRVMAPVGSDVWNEAQRAAYSDAGFVFSLAVPPYRTFLLDVGRPLAEVRRNLVQKWRSCLNQSERQGVVVRAGTSPALFQEFCDLYSPFLQHKRFEVNLPAAFYQVVQEQLAEDDRFCIHLAQIEDRVVAGHVASFLGDTCVYLLGASNEEGRESKASYLLQWRVIQAAHQRGFQWYDLGGIDPEDNSGVYHFKRGLGGQDVVAPGPLECPAPGLRRAAVCWSERAYRLLRGLK